MLAGTGLVALGALLGTVERWGAPAGPVLRRLAVDLRADARAATEEAAARAELYLVYSRTNSFERGQGSAHDGDGEALRRA